MSRCSMKCVKPGPVTRNPYLNFLRQFRKEHCGMSVREIVRLGAKKWRSMNKCQRAKYMRSASSAPRPSSPRKKKTKSCPIKCARPGPVTRNPYLNFLREFRKLHCGMPVRQIVRIGAKKWRCMTKSQKEKYMRAASGAPKMRRRRSTC